MTLISLKHDFRQFRPNFTDEEEKSRMLYRGKVKKARYETRE
jgi:hypothetical protein